MYIVSRALLLTGISVVFLTLSNSAKPAGELIYDPFSMPVFICGQSQSRSLALPSKFQVALAGINMPSVPAGNGTIPLIAGLDKVGLPVTTSGLTSRWRKTP